MAKLVFFDENHTYQIDGEEVPSVSEVTRFVSREVYGDISQYKLDNASERGTNVHKATELLDKYGTVECSDDITGYVKAYVKFRKDFGIKNDNIVEIEKPYGDAELGYAGTLDRIFLISDEYWLVDIKSSCAPQKKLWSIGLNGYKQLWEKKNKDKKISRMFDLHLKADGTYKIVDVDFDTEIFNACLKLHNYMKTKKRKAKKEE